MTEIQWTLYPYVGQAQHVKEWVAIQLVAVVFMSFEAAGDAVEDKRHIASFIKEFAIPYPVLLAGAIDEVPDKLPQLVGFGAYPTTIYLGRDGRVRGIHAGFASSATGEASVLLAREIQSIIEHLLADATTSTH